MLHICNWSLVFLFFLHIIVYINIYFKRVSQHVMSSNFSNLHVGSVSVVSCLGLRSVKFYEAWCVYYLGWGLVETWKSGVTGWPLPSLAQCNIFSAWEVPFLVGSTILSQWDKIPRLVWLGRAGARAWGGFIKYLKAYNRERKTSSSGAGIVHC